MRFAGFLALIGLFFTNCLDADAGSLLRIRVHTEGSVATLVTANLPAKVTTGNLRLIVLPERKEVPCDLRLLDKGVLQLIWVHLGGRRDYLVELDKKPSAAVRWQTSLQNNVLQVTCDGKLVLRYVFRGAPKPYIYPIHTQTGVPITRAFPMEQREGESTDHPHQRSFWFTHGDVNGTDFWAEGSGRGRIVHKAFEDTSGGRVGTFVLTSNEWRTPQGEVVCTDTREVCVYDMDDLRIIDFTVKIRAGGKPVRFGDTKEGTFGIRIPSSMELRRGKGTILTAAGKRDREAWGTRAAWCRYSGDIGGEEYSITVFDHPGNPSHPTYWHVRDYGLLSANPFGARDFESNPSRDGSLTIPANGEVTFRYRVLFAKGALAAEKLNALYQPFAAAAKVELAF